jgi:hypothetical protein
VRLRAPAALLALLAGAIPALADTFDGRITGTENWTLSPGGGAVNFNWGANWHVDPFLHTLTLRQTLRLSAAAGSGAVTAAELTDWETRIEAAWNRPDIYAVSNDIIHGVITNWALNYDITLVTAGGTPDYTVTVRDGSGSTDTGNWYRTGGSGVNRQDLNVAAHETGHYLANPDEYTNGGAIIPGSPWNAPAFTTTSLMNNTNAPPNTPVGVTQVRHYWLWGVAMQDYFTHKGIEGKSFEIVPAPASGTLVMAGLLAFRRRRR